MRRFLLRLLRRRRLEDDLDLELAHHRAMAAAHDNAIPLGSDLRIKEAVRDLWRFSFVEDVWRDLRLAARSLVRQRGFAVFALLALVIGIGLNGAVFMALNAMALRPWPVRDPGRVVTAEGRSISIADFRQIRDGASAFEGVAFTQVGIARVSMDGREWSAELVSAEYFEVLGVPMALGRPFAPLEDRSEAPEAVVVLAHAFWTAQFGADPDVLGRQIRLNDVPFTVVGIATPEFSGGDFPRHLWLPAASQTLLVQEAPTRRDDVGCCTLVARLAAGVSRRQAQAELDVIVSRFPDRGTRPGLGPEPETLIGTRRIDRPGAARGMLPMFLMAQVAVGAILLLACANVGNLVLARAMARDREIAVRVSLGAGRWRIVRQLLAEAILLAAAASLAILLFFLYVSAAPDRWDSDTNVWTLGMHVDLRVLGYMAAVALCTTIVCGLAPALQVTRPNLMAAMQRTSAQATPRLPLRGVLLGVQVAISVAVLVCAALLVRGAHRAANLDIGFVSAGVSTISVHRGAEELVARVRERLQPFGPVGVASQPPMGFYSAGRMTLPASTARGEEMVTVTQAFVDGGYFDVLGIPVVAGRSFSPQDRGRDVVLVNEAMARRYWPGESALGRPVRLAVDRPDAAWTWDGTSFRRTADEREHQIVGIVRDAHLARLGDVEPMLFRVHAESEPLPTLLVPTAVAAMAAATIEEIGGQAGVEPLSARVDAELLSSRFSAQLATALGLIALLLAATGVYGVIAYAVQGRRREIGIRMALGATPRAVIRVVLGPNVRAVLAGLGAGLVLSMLASIVFVGRLYGISRLDPAAYGAVLLLLLAAGVAASAIPARQAARIDPIEVLRAE